MGIRSGEKRNIIMLELNEKDILIVVGGEFNFPEEGSDGTTGPYDPHQEQRDFLQF